MKKRTVFFGAGGTANKARELLGNSIELIGYVDNNSKKWGSTVDNLPVHNPEILTGLHFDQIAIAMLKGVGTVRDQLHALGIPDEKIFVPITNSALFYNDTIADPSLQCSDTATTQLLIKSPEIIFRFWYLHRHRFQPATRTEIPLKLREFLRLTRPKVQINTPQQELYEIASDSKQWAPCNRSANFYELLSTLDCATALEILQSYTELAPQSRLKVTWNTAAIDSDESDEEQMVENSLCAYAISCEQNYCAFLNILEDLHRISPSASVPQTLNDLEQLSNLEIHVALRTATEESPSALVSPKKNKIESATHTQAIAMSRILFSAPTLSFHAMRIPHIKTDSFHTMLDEAKAAIKQNNIPLDSVGVTSGGILRAFGMKETDDIDIIMTSPFRRLYGDGLVIVSDHVEMHPMNEYPIADDQLILDPRNYFTYNGIKFVTLSNLLEQRQGTNTMDTRLIQLFMNACKNKSTIIDSLSIEGP